MRAWRAIACASFAAAGGCALLIGEPDAYVFTADASTEAEAPDVGAPPQSDASQPLPDSGVTFTYNDLGQSKNWEVFDLSPVDGGTGARLANFFSAGFDGRYLYFFQSNTDPPAIVLRYDTTGSFTAKSSYATFDLTTINGSSPGFRGAVYASPYLYLVPSTVRTDGGGFGLSPFVRYDPRNDSAFNDKAAWLYFDLGAADPSTGTAFWGGTFDGTYVYYTAARFAPQATVRYRVGSDFTSTTSFERIQVGTIDKTLNAPATPTTDPTNGHIMAGAVFDGRYVIYPGSQFANYFLRYDTKGDFLDVPAAWSAFDITQVVDAGASGTPQYFQGGAFDGRYSYYRHNRFTSLVRYDHQGPFAAPSSWTVARPTVLGTAHGQANVFDGRYVYIARQDQLAVRYDTTKDFAADSSYESFDMSTLNPGANDFGTTIFDGRYVYYVPNNAPVIIRFDAKSPPALPPTYHGSAF